VTRRDYFEDPNSPTANSIVVACSVYVTNEARQVLMIRRTDNNLYSIPGGQMEPGETVRECAIRETREETGIDVNIVDLVGIYSNPAHVIEYDDGEVRQEFSICFRGVAAGGATRPSNESKEVLWANPEDLAELDIHPSTRLRLQHALNGVSQYFT
jgi:ADP-ribose pyrophosphatase YjhB (NUDIX family)